MLNSIHASTSSASNQNPSLVEGMINFKKVIHLQFKQNYATGIDKFKGCKTAILVGAILLIALGATTAVAIMTGSLVKAAIPLVIGLGVSRGIMMFKEKQPPLKSLADSEFVLLSENDDLH